MNIVITGTSRGIGLELCRQALSKKSSQVLAIARNPEKSAELQDLKKQHPNLQLLAVELKNPEAPAKIFDAVKSWPSVDLLLNNAGVYHQGTKAEDFLDSFHVNSVMPFLLTQALLPQLKKSAHAKVASISSLMGSIEDNSSGGSYAYRSSKTALNMINKGLAVDNPWLTAVVLHPGWVETDMGGKGAPVKIPDSAQGLWKVIDALTKEQTGSFIDFRGQKLHW